MAWENLSHAQIFIFLICLSSYLSSCGCEIDIGVLSAHLQVMLVLLPLKNVHLPLIL